MENEAFAKALQLYWPIAAIVLLGLISIIGARSKSVRVSPAVAATTAPTDDSQELHLQQQLAHLIDSDPATAAKVIKSWIRQTS